MRKLPPHLGSFSPDDVVLLLTDLTGKVPERDIAQREREIQAGRHYSEDLPIEKPPSPAYMEVFNRLLQSQARAVALYTGIVTRLIAARYAQPVLVSLVRAGTPSGVLIRRYARRELGMDWPHYTVSIIRGKGFDENAILTILDRQPGRPLVFVDGWTGKGMIATELAWSCATFNRRHGAQLQPILAVLADPAHCSELFATREDFINPSCCLNSTVCGLISRSVHSKALIGPEDFHGVRVYHEFADIDQTAQYLDAVTTWFAPLRVETMAHAIARENDSTPPDWIGMDAVRRIGAEFGIQDMNRIKPSIGETTRVLLRRVPDRVLVRDPGHPDLSHILLLAQEKNVPVETYPHMPYLCCGLIADQREDKA